MPFEIVWQIFGKNVSQDDLAPTMQELKLVLSSLWRYFPLDLFQWVPWLPYAWKYYNNIWLVVELFE